MIAPAPVSDDLDDAHEPEPSTPEDAELDEHPGEAATNGARLRVDDDAWRESLIYGTSRRGEQYVLPVGANVATILRYHPRWRGVVAYDAFAEAIMTTAAPPWHPADAPGATRIGEWTDADTARVVNWLQRVEAVRVSPAVVEQAVATVAETSVTHPVRDYLRGLMWDQTERLSAMLVDYFGGEPSPYACAVGQRWMISAVARVFRPGCQVDCTLIFEGPQGFGKTSALRELVPVPSWYADTGVTIGDKDSYQCLRGVWIYGLDELDSLRRGDVTKWKTYLTQTQDRYRASYGRRARTIPRQTVFCGTTNETEYLTDRTGNRRLWPTRVVRPIDPRAIAAVRDQLWAEAVARYHAGEPWHVDTRELRALCEREQADRVQPDPWTPIVAGWLAQPRVRDAHGQQGEPYDARRGVLTTDVALHALGMRPGDVGTAHHMRVATVLRELGYDRGPLHREDGSRVRRYVRPPSPAGGDGELGGDDT